MRLPLVALALSATGLASAMEGPLHSEYYGGYRFGGGVAPGIDKHKAESSTTSAGAPDPAQDGETSLTAKLGSDFYGGIFFNTSLDGGLGVAILPMVFYRDTRGSGTAAGGVTVRDELKAWGGRLGIGPALTMGPVALEVTPFVGIGGAWMETEYSAAGVSTRRGSGANLFIDYGISGQAFYRFESNFYLGGSVGFDAFRSKVNSPAAGALDKQEITVSGAGLLASGMIGFWF
jgi:hypothetical protein